MLNGPSVFPPELETKLKYEFLGAKPGFYVEVGANQPKNLSQTWELEQRGWSGVLVEPQPALASELRRQRTAQVFEAACSSPQNAGSKMTLHLAGPYSSFDVKLNVPTVRPHASCDVAVRTLDDILMEASAPRSIDFVSIDVEGHEVDVLAGFDLARWNPRLLMVEDLITNLRLHNALAGKGYRLIRRTGINNWYIPRETPFRVGLIGRWQLFNKMYLGLAPRIIRFAWRRWRSVPKPVD